MELATYNITFEWISEAHNKAADCLSCLVELPEDKPVMVKMLSATNTDGPAFNTRSQTHQHLSPDFSISQPDVTPEVTETMDYTPKSLTADGAAFNTRSQTHQHLSPDTSTSQPDVTPEVTETMGSTPRSITADRLQAFLQMQKTDCFCK